MGGAHPDEPIRREARTFPRRSFCTARHGPSCIEPEGAKAKGRRQGLNPMHAVPAMLGSHRELLRGNDWARRQSLGSHLEHEPSEKQRVGKDDERANRGNRVADFVARMR
jgi:hypothetical protein